MFKTASFEDELYRSMEKTLTANQSEQKTGLKRIAQATAYLNAAAELFSQAGLTEEAEEVAEVLEGLAGQNDQ